MNPRHSIRLIASGAACWLGLSGLAPEPCLANNPPAPASPSQSESKRAPDADDSPPSSQAGGTAGKPSADPSPATEASAPTDSDDPRARQEAERATEARSLFEAGAKAFADRHNASAIVYFQRAQALLPNSKLTYNIGLAYEDMGDLTHALFHYLSYLHQQPQSPQRDEVLSRIHRLEEQLAVSGVQHLSVTTQPAGALVLVDDRPRGVTPFADHFPPGTHQLQLIREGYETRETTVHLQADRAFEVRMSLQPSPAEPPRFDRSLRPITWTLLSVGAGGLLGGVLFEAARGNARDDARAARDPTAAAHFAGAAQAHQLASLSSFGVGLSLLTVGSYFAYDDLRERPLPHSVRPTSVRLPCSNQYCGVVASGTF